MQIPFEQLINAIGELITIFDTSGHLLFASEPLCKLLGYTVTELTRMTKTNLQSSGLYDSLIHTETQGQSTFRTVCRRFRKKDNSSLQLQVITHIIFVNNQQLIVNLYQSKPVDNHQPLIYPEESSLNNHHPISSQIVAESEAMKSTLEIALRVACYDTTVLIVGESGSGKEVLANYIHQNSPRASHRLVKVNCASLPETLLESELFGYERGAFTGASSSGRAGLIESAHCGTLFLDEIDSLPLSLQGKLLGVIENKKYMKLGSNKESRSDFRLLTASNANLEAMVKERQFRQDLYYRINVVPIRIPSLSARPEDIIPLANYFLNHYNRKYDKNKKFSDSVLGILTKHHWPGNVREIKNFVERMVVTSASDVIDTSDLPKDHSHVLIPNESLTQTHGSPEQFTLRTLTPSYLNDKSYHELISEFEETLIRHALSIHSSAHKAAKALKVNQSTISRKAKKFGLE